MRSRTLRIAVITLMALLIVSPASAQQVNWVELLSIRDLTGNVLLQKDQPLIVGHSYNVTIRISVPFSQPTSDFVVALDLNMNLVGTQY